MSEEDKSGSSAENRKSQRKKSLLRATLYFHRGSSAVSGLIRDMSEDGARFVTDYEIELPAEATLVLSNNIEYDARIVRTKNNKEFGLSFSSKGRINQQQLNETARKILSELYKVSPETISVTLDSARFMDDRQLMDSIFDFEQSHAKLVEKIRSKISN